MLSTSLLARRERKKWLVDKLFYRRRAGSYGIWRGAAIAGADCGFLQCASTEAENRGEILRHTVVSQGRFKHTLFRLRILLRGGDPPLACTGSQGVGGAPTRNAKDPSTRQVSVCFSDVIFICLVYHSEETQATEADRLGRHDANAKHGSALY